MAIRIIIFCVVFLISLAALIKTVSKKYKEALKKQDWYDDFYYEFESVGCPHTKRVKFSDTKWTFHFNPRKEVTTSKRKGLITVSTTKVSYRLFCEECHKKRWFRETNSMKDRLNLNVMRLKYFLIFGAALFPLLAISLNVFFGFII